MNWRWLLIVILLIACIAGLWIAGPIPQWPEYHNFADQRPYLRIPNFLNVITNVPFFFLGVWGLSKVFKNWRSWPDFSTVLIPFIFFVGVFLVSFGSSWYHWVPDNFTMVWDRGPMTLMFMSLFSFVIYDFIGEKEGKFAIWILVPIGIFSIWSWYYSELMGRGDLRIYAMVQFLPMLLAPVIIWLYWKPVSYIRHLILLLVFYALAKGFEHFDDEVYNTVFIMSGHSIKHLLGAFAIYHGAEAIWGWKSGLVLEESQQDTSS